jgi:hypothetical protein
VPGSKPGERAFGVFDPDISSQFSALETQDCHYGDSLVLKNRYLISTFSQLNSSDTAC